jgi:hypothetical protein
MTVFRLMSPLIQIKLTQIIYKSTFPALHNFNFKFHNFNSTFSHSQCFSLSEPIKIHAIFLMVLRLELGASLLLGSSSITWATLPTQDGYYFYPYFILEKTQETGNHNSMYFKWETSNSVRSTDNAKWMCPLFLSEVLNFLIFPKLFWL